MRVLERPKSPLPSVSRLIPNVSISKPNMPTMPKLYGKPYRHDQPLLSNEHRRTDNHDANAQHTRRQKKLAPSAESHIKNFAHNVKNKASSTTQNFTSKINLRPVTTRASYGFTVTESRDDELEERYLLTANSEECIRLSFGEDRDMPVSLGTEAVDFGGFDEPVGEKVEEERDIVSVSSASVSVKRMEAVDFGAFDEAVEKEMDTADSAVSVSSDSASVKEEDTSIDSREYSRMYATITRGGVSEESEPSIVTECGEEEPAEAVVETASAKELDEVSVGSVASVQEMNAAYQLNVPDENSVSEKTSVGSAESAKVEDSSIDDRTSTSSYLIGVYLKEDETAVSQSDDADAIGVSDTNSVVSSTAPSSVLYGMNFVQENECDDAVEDYSNQPYSVESDGNEGDETGGVLPADRAKEMSTTEDPSYATPETTKLPTIPTMTFSVDSPSIDRQFMISEKPVVVTPTEGGDVIELGGLAAVAFAAQDRGLTDANDQKSIDVVRLEPQVKSLEGQNELQESKMTDKIPSLLPSSSNESATSNSTTAALSFSGLQVHNFDDDIFNATQLEEQSVSSDFNTRDDWQPQDDNDSVCSQPFGCCTINVDVKRSILNQPVPLIKEVSPQSTPRPRIATAMNQVDDMACSKQQAADALSPPSTPTAKHVEGGSIDNEAVVVPIASDKIILIEELSPPNTPTKINQCGEQLSLNLSHNFVYPEINMLDLSDDESEGESSSNSSHQFDLFHLSDRFREESNDCVEPNSDAEDADSDSGDDNVDEEAASEEEAIDNTYDIDEESSKESLGEKSCVSNIRSESGKALSAVSDEGGADFELLKNFWVKEWNGVTSKQETVFDHSATDSECRSVKGTQQDLMYEYADIDGQSYASRTLLATVEEEVSEESSGDDSISSAIEQDTIEVGVHLMSADQSDESSSVTAEDNQYVTVTNGAENDTEQDDSLYLGDVDVQSTPPANVTFRYPRNPKKQCIRAKKWAVVKAKTNRAAKFSIGGVNEAPSRNNIEDESRAPETDMDSVVKAALDLISKRTGAEAQENPAKDEQSSVESSQLTTPEASFTPSGNTNQTVPPAIITCEPEIKPTDRLGQLQHYLGPMAIEKTQNHAGIAIEAPRDDASDEYASDEDAVEDNIEQVETKATLTSEVKGEDSLIVEDKEQDVTQELNAREEPSAFMQFDDVHPPELGSLAQKLYYTNTELAETLAMTQSELLMANKRVEALVLERNHLIANKVVPRNGESGDELLVWLDEKNELID